MASNLYKASFAYGQKAESVFQRVAQAKGWKTRRATQREDMLQHWDIEMEKEHLKLKLDVKAMKRQSRSDSQVQSNWTWIELRGVNEGNEGWLYGGIADLLAFQRESDFVLVSRQDVMDTVEKLVDPLLPRVYSAREAKYRVYNRPGRHDLITMIQMTDILPYAWKIWKYE